MHFFCTAVRGPTKALRKKYDSQQPIEKFLVPAALIDDIGALVSAVPGALVGLCSAVDSRQRDGECDTLAGRPCCELYLSGTLGLLRKQALCWNRGGRGRKLSKYLVFV